MSHKVKIEIEVEVEAPGPDPRPEDFVFLNLKVGTEPSIPLPAKEPAPRRLAATLALAAGKLIVKAT